MLLSDGQIVDSISDETMPGYVAIRAVVRVGAKWVVRNSPQTGVRGVQCSALLIEIRIGHIQHKAALVAPRDFGLEGVGICMPEVSEGDREPTTQREGHTIK